jgi:hypothetical protein
VEKRSNIVGLVLLGATIGIYHLFLGISSISVFREGGPLASRIAIIAGPFSTLPGVLIAIFRRKLGAALLIAGGVVSLTALSLAAGVSADIVPFSLLVAIPMIIIGGGFLILQKERR